MIGWHFTSGRVCAHDAQPIVVGETITVDPPLALCSRGLHASERILDALVYAPGSLCWRVELSGEILRGTDKLCAQHRRALWVVDAEAILWRFARWCSLQVAPFAWPDGAPEAVLRWLVLGDESARAAARAAARDAAWDAARAAARDAANRTLEAWIEAARETPAFDVRIHEHEVRDAVRPLVQRAWALGEVAR